MKNFTAIFFHSQDSYNIFICPSLHFAFLIATAKACSRAASNYIIIIIFSCSELLNYDKTKLRRKKS